MIFIEQVMVQLAGVNHLQIVLTLSIISAKGTQIGLMNDGQLPVIVIS